MIEIEKQIWEIIEYIDEQIYSYFRGTYHRDCRASYPNKDTIESLKIEADKVHINYLNNNSYKPVSFDIPFWREKVVDRNLIVGKLLTRCIGCELKVWKVAKSWYVYYYNQSTDSWKSINVWFDSLEEAEEFIQMVAR